MFFPVLFALIAGLFLLIKLPLSMVSLSDTNVYIEMAHHLLQGKLLYKDMFLTNMPFFPYLSVVYLQLTRGNLSLFYCTAVFEALATSIIIYLSLQQKGRPRSIAVMCASSYLFSMIVLATSDHQTGIFFASLMAALGYYLYQRKQYAFSGIALGLMFVTKGYMMPIIAVMFLYDIYKRRQQSWLFIVAGMATIFIVLLPTLIYARGELWNDIFGYTLHRPTGLDKWNILRFFFLYQWLYVVAMVVTFVRYRKNILLAGLLFGGICFILLYQDVYFFYLNLLMPFLSLALGDSIELLAQKLGRMNGLLVATLLITVSMLFSYKVYIDSISRIGKVQRLNEITAAIQKNHPQRLFGAVELTPTLSYLTNVPLLDDIIDTNESLFTRNVYDLSKIKKDLYATRTMVVTLGVNREMQLSDGQMKQVTLEVIPTIYKPLELEKKCKLVLSKPVFAEGIVNRINLWKCY